MHIFSFFATYLKGSGRLLTLIILLSLVDQTLSVYCVYLWKDIIDIYLLGMDGMSADQFIRGIGGMAALWIGLAMISRISKNIQSYEAMVLADRTSLDFFEQAYRHVIYLSINFHASHKTGMVMRRLTKARDDMSKIINAFFVKVVMQIISFILVTAMFFVIQWQVGVVMLMFLPLFLWVTHHFAGNIDQAQNEINDELELVHGSVQQALDSYQVVLSFHSQETEIGRLEENHDISHRCTKKKTIVFQKLAFWQGTLINLTRVCIISYGGYFVYVGEMTVGEVVLLSTWAYSIYWPLYQVSDLYALFTEGFNSISRVEELLEKKPRIRSPEEPHTPEHVSGNVAFKNVTFHYPVPRGRFIEDISFEIPMGRHAAIVGPSGSGKSTITKLLPRFYDVESGSVSIDGVDVREWELNKLRDSVGMVLQEVYLFNDTILANIRYGNEGRSMDEVINAAKMAHAHHFITSLPQAYDTMVGERGIKLSGGEKQRVALARTILRNPRILILDEATSALDSESETAVLEALEEVSLNRTTITIAHRLSTIRHSDLILFLEEGRIVERGNHETLMALKGRYFNYVDLQSRKEDVWL